MPRGRQTCPITEFIGQANWKEKGCHNRYALDQESLTDINGWRCSGLLLLLETRTAILYLMMLRGLSSDNSHVPARLCIC